MGPLGALGWPCSVLWSMSSSPPYALFSWFLPLSSPLSFFYHHTSLSSNTCLTCNPTPPHSFNVFSVCLLHPPLPLWWLPLFARSRFFTHSNSPCPFSLSPLVLFSISTASLINNASQHITNISRVLSARQREGGDETVGGEEWVAPFLNKRCGERSGLIRSAGEGWRCGLKCFAPCGRASLHL